MPSRAGSPVRRSDELEEWLPPGQIQIARPSKEALQVFDGVARFDIRQTHHDDLRPGRASPVSSIALVVLISARHDHTAHGRLYGDRGDDPGLIFRMQFIQTVENRDDAIVLQQEEPSVGAIDLCA